MGNSDVVVTLVHGTFARKAKWLEPDGTLYAALTDAGCHVVPFRWSGKNAFWARKLAADQLADYLESVAGQHPNRRQWVIAHSHGGNVAVHATHGGAQREGLRSIGVITLATPFIHSTFKTGSGRGSAAGVFLITLSAAILFWLDWPNLVVRIVALLLALSGLLLMSLLLAARKRNGSLAKTEPLSVFLRYAHAPTAQRADLLAIRASGDEASGIMTAGQFSGWIAQKAVTTLVAIEMLAAAVPSAIAVLSGSTPESLPLWLRMCTYIAMGAVVCSVPLLYFQLAAPIAFGWDGPYAGEYTLMTAESLPPGDAEMVQLQPFSDTDRRGLHHSRLYDEPDVIKLVIDRICERSTTDAP